MNWIAHRSGPTVYPEQTIASARLALQSGADMVELDVRFTEDRQLAVSHDEDLSRVFGEKWECRTVSAQQFRSLRHKSDSSFCSHLFEDYLRCGVFPLLIHVKEKETVPAILHLVKAYDCAEKVVLGLEDAESVEVVRQADPSIRILAFMRTAADTEAFAALGVEYIRLWEGWLTEETVARVKESGAALWVMSGEAEPGRPVGEPSVEGLWRIAQWEPAGILVNNVPFARSVLEAE